MTTLREAAQQALEALEEVNKSPWLEDCYHAFDDEVTALHAALAEPVQEAPTEPVAMLWQHRETGRPRLLLPNERTTTDDAAAWDVVGPLYLAPPQRKPLTEEEISNIWDGHVVPVFGKNGINPIVFARAIEAKHGIGGQQ